MIDSRSDLPSDEDVRSEGEERPKLLSTSLTRSSGGELEAFELDGGLDGGLDDGGVEAGEMDADELNGLDAFAINNGGLNTVDFVDKELALFFAKAAADCALLSFVFLIFSNSFKISGLPISFKIKTTSYV